MEFFSLSFTERWFGQYDYGAAGNMKKYGSPNPPKYDLSKIKVPITLMYSGDDWLSSHEVNINFITYSNKQSIDKSISVDDIIMSVILLKMPSCGNLMIS